MFQSVTAMLTVLRYRVVLVVAGLTFSPPTAAGAETDLGSPDGMLLMLVATLTEELVEAVTGEGRCICR